MLRWYPRPPPTAIRRIRRAGARSAATRIVPAAQARSTSTATANMREGRFTLPGRAGAIAYDQLRPCVDTVVASHDLSAGRPCERRDPSPLASKSEKGLGFSAGTRLRAAAMSAIALTLGSLRSQGRLIAIALPSKGW